jgi:addiction module HigA family antidote
VKFDGMRRVEHRATGGLGDRRFLEARRGTKMDMHDPPHPGEIIREDCLKPLGLTVTAAAKGLGVSRGSLSELLNGHNGVSAEMAIRLEKAGWSQAETWLRMQLSYDLWHAKRRADGLKVIRFEAPEPA